MLTCHFLVGSFFGGVCVAVVGNEPGTKINQSSTSLVKESKGKEKEKRTREKEIKKNKQRIVHIFSFIFFWKGREREEKGVGKS